MFLEMRGYKIIRESVDVIKLLFKFDYNIINYNILCLFFINI